RLHLPGTGRALIIARADGGLIASQPVAEDAKDVAEALAHMLHLATGALERAGLGPLHRAIVDDGHDAVFTRTDGELMVSLAPPRSAVSWRRAPPAWDGRRSPPPCSRPTPARCSSPAAASAISSSSPTSRSTCRPSAARSPTPSR